MRRLLGWMVIVAALVLAEPSFGQNYPSRLITLIVPYAAGGGVDAVARVIGETLGERLGQKIDHRECHRRRRGHRNPARRARPA